MLETRQDYLLDMIQRASEALAALFVATTPGARVDDDEQDLDRALDDVFSGLDAHAHRQGAATLRAILRRDDRVLLFAILQARKGLQRRHAGDHAGAEARLRCAHDLLHALLAAGSPLADIARPLAELLADFLP